MTAWVNSSSLQVLRVEERERGRQADAELALSWHLRQATECEQGRDRFAAAFHHARRGRAFAEEGRWGEAVEEFARAADLDASDAGHIRRQAWALLAGGDQQGYRQLCVRLRRDFGDKPEPSIANAIAYTIALSPASGIDPERLTERAQVVVKGDPRNPDKLETLGAALYRAGKYQSAAETLATAVELQGEGGTTWQQLFLAMAHHRLGNAGKAHDWLDKCDRRGGNDRAIGLLGASSAGPLPALTWLAVPTAEPPLSADDWEERLIRRLLRREADDVLKTKPGAGPE
jgi:tetratricopeptide (TPR) repeat protein